MIKVTKEEFNDFIGKYPVPLETSVSFISEPPSRFYYPKGSTNALKDAIARVALFETYPKDRIGQHYGWEPNEHWIEK